VPSVSFYQFFESFEQKKHYNLHAFHLGFQKKNQIIRNISNFFKGTENWQLDETLCNDLIKMRQKKITYLFVYSLI